MSTHTQAEPTSRDRKAVRDLMAAVRQAITAAKQLERAQRRLIGVTCEETHADAGTQQ